MTRPDCWTCRHSSGADAQTTRRLAVDRGYGDDYSAPRGGVSIVCELRRRINAEPRSTLGRPCKYERGTGTEK